MSAALTTDERALLSSVLSVFQAARSPALAPLVELISKLERLSECSQCGVLFEAVGIAPACPHCCDEMRREDARAATGGDL